MRKFWTASVATLAFTLMAAPASAQAPWSGAGELTDSDSAGDEQRRYDDHVIQLEAGQRYRISVDSSAFDPVARLYRQGSTDVVAENDDGEGFNSRITITPTESGAYTLRVLAFGPDGRGAYTAGVVQLPALPPAQAVPWQGSGQIEISDPTDSVPLPSEAEGPAERVSVHYDEHVLRLEGGQRYILRVNSAAFDPVARLYRDGETSPVMENDDGDDGLNARISFRPETSGTYILRVAPIGSDGRGAYTASAALAPALPAPLTAFTGQRTMVWKVYTGALTNADGESVAGARVDDYLVRFTAGQERFIALDAAEFDAVVQVIAADRRDTDETLASNDDGGNSLNSMLRFKADTAGDYIVRVTSLGGAGRGDYTLRVSD